MVGGDADVVRNLEARRRILHLKLSQYLSLVDTPADKAPRGPSVYDNPLARATPKPPAAAAAVAPGPEAPSVQARREKKPTQARGVGAPAWLTHPPPPTMPIPQELSDRLTFSESERGVALQMVESLQQEIASLSAEIQRLAKASMGAVAEGGVPGRPDGRHTKR